MRVQNEQPQLSESVRRTNTPGWDVQKASRQYYLDWLRVFALLTVFLFHSTKVFSYGDFFVKDRQLDWGMELFDWIVGLWVMPLFFVLAALASFFSLASRDNRHFLLERSKRLLIPLLLGVFLLSPVPVYLERLTHGQFTGSFWQFLPHYFDGWYGFGGNFAWMGLHLWFLLLLFLFSLVTLPLLRYLKQGRQMALALRKLQLSAVIVLVALVLCTSIVEVLVNLQPDGIGRRDFGGWSVLTYLVGFFLGGYLLTLFPEVLDSFQRNRTKALLLGLCTTLIYLVLVLGYRSSSFSLPSSFLRAATAWLWVSALLGFAKQYLSVNKPVLSWANQAVMPFYVLHVPVIVVVAFLLLPYNIPLLAKFPLMTLLSCVIILGLYQYLIQPA